MGIKDLGGFIKKNSPGSLIQMPLNLFYRRRIGIDSANWAFKYLKTTGKSWQPEDPFDEIDYDDLYRVLFDEMTKFNINLMEHHITPVWIWDGKAHEYKTKEKEKRRTERQGRIEEKERLKKRLMDLPPFERDEDEVKKYKKLVESTSYVPKEIYDKLHKDMISLGIPSLIAPYEGETYAANLAIQRKLAAVWTADTDILAIGCPIKLSGYVYEGSKRLDAFNATYLFDLLEDLEMDIHTFRDFCILCGCDFNDRMKGIGPGKGYKLFKKHGSIEEISKLMDTSCLNIEQCREMLYLEHIITPDDELNVHYQEDYSKYQSQSDLILSLMQAIRLLKEPEDIKRNYKIHVDHV